MYISVKDIVKSTGLEYNFILKAVRKLDTIFTPDLVKRGASNSMIFKQEPCYYIFDRIKQLKDHGLTLSQIKDELEKTIKTNVSTPLKSNAKTDKTKNSNDILTEMLEDTNKRAFETFSDLVKTKDSLINALESKITLMLPAGINEKDYVSMQSKVTQLENEISYLRGCDQKLQKIKPLFKQLLDLENNILNFTSSNHKKKLLSDILSILL